MAQHAQINQWMCELVIDREAWRAAIHGVAKSWTRLSELNWTEPHLTQKRQNYMIFSDVGKAFNKIQHSWYKLLRNWVQRELLQCNKSNKPTANIILSSEKWKDFLVKSKSRQGCPLSPLLFNTVLEVLATAIRQEKQIEGIQIRSEEETLSFENVRWYIENRNNPHKNYYNC